MTAPFITTLTLAGLLGLVSFGVGMLPLSLSFSKRHLSWISRLGTGLLLGTAMGVIIPEGVEALIANSGTQELPTRTLALSLLAGFCLMLLVEQLGSSTHDGHSHARAPPDTPWLPTTPRSSASPAVEFDVELAQLESEQGTPLASAAPAAPRSAYTLTTGLVIHGLADGFALGVSAFPSGNDSSGLSELSLVVFMALAVHKAPTALAFTISLLSTSLPRAECQKHLLVFSSSTPLGAMLAFAILYFTGLGDRSRVGAALLVSGGSFLYVATVLQPVDHTAGEGGDKKERRFGLFLLLVGCFFPLILSGLVGHGH